MFFFSEECSKLWKWWFFSVFNRLGPFPQAFRQVKEWLRLELHKTIRGPHIVACPIVFVLFYDRSCHGWVFKVMKNNYFLMFSVVCVPFPKFLGRLTNGFCSTIQNNKTIIRVPWNNKSVTYSAQLFLFLCFMSEVGTEECSKLIIF